MKHIKCVSNWAEIYTIFITAENFNLVYTLSHVTIKHFFHRLFHENPFKNGIKY